MPKKRIKKKSHVSKYQPKYMYKKISNDVNRKRKIPYNEQRQEAIQRLSLGQYVKKEIKVTGEITGIRPYRQNIIKLVLRNVHTCDVKPALTIDHLHIKLRVRKEDMRKHIKMHQKIAIVGTVFQYCRNFNVFEVSERIVNMRTQSYSLRQNRLLREETVRLNKNPVEVVNSNHTVSPLQQQLHLVLTRSNLAAILNQTQLVKLSANLAETADSLRLSPDRIPILTGYTAKIIKLCELTNSKQKGANN